MRERAWEQDVSMRKIMNDIMALAFDYPVYTKPGEGGGVFITERSLKMSEKRKDNKGRILKTGESQRKDLIYQYRYTDIYGKRQTIYSSFFILVFYP